MTPTSAERALYADLTALMLRMRGEPLALVEAAIEQRFQDFVRKEQPDGCGSLEITYSYTVHDGAQPWTVYGTEYRIRAMEPPAAAARIKRARPLPGLAAAAATTNVIPFPTAASRNRPVPAHIAWPAGN